MKSAVVDSSVVVDFLRQKDKTKTTLYRLIEEGVELGLPMIVGAEMYSGKSVWQNKGARKMMDEMLSGMRVIPMTMEHCVLAGEIRAKFGVDLIDALIAATAKINKLSLVTLNKKHFLKVKGLKIH